MGYASFTNWRRLEGDPDTIWHAFTHPCETAQYEDHKRKPSSVLVVAAARGSSPARWCARSSRESSSGYAVKAGVTSSVGSVTV